MIIMSPEVIIMAAATIIGPVTAVLISMMLQRKAEERQRAFQQELTLKLERERQDFESKMIRAQLNRQDRAGMSLYHIAKAIKPDRPHPLDQRYGSEQ